MHFSPLYPKSLNPTPTNLLSSPSSPTSPLIPYHLSPHLPLLSSPVTCSFPLSPPFSPPFSPPPSALFNLQSPAIASVIYVLHKSSAHILHNFVVFDSQHINRAACSVALSFNARTYARTHNHTNTYIYILRQKPSHLHRHSDTMAYIYYRY